MKPRNDTHIGLHTNKCDFHSKGGHPPTANECGFPENCGRFEFSRPKKPSNDTHIGILTNKCYFHSNSGHPPTRRRRTNGDFLKMVVDFNSASLRCTEMTPILAYFQINVIFIVTACTRRRRTNGDFLKMVVDLKSAALRCPKMTPISA